MCCTPSVAVIVQCSTFGELATVISSIITDIHTIYKLFAPSLPFPCLTPFLPPALSPFRPPSPFPPVRSRSHTAPISSTPHSYLLAKSSLACLLVLPCSRIPFPPLLILTPSHPVPSAPVRSAPTSCSYEDDEDSGTE